MILSRSILAADAGVACAAAARQRDAVGTEKFTGNFLRFKTTAALAFVIRRCWRCFVHALPKFSAIAIAFRIAMLLLTVS